MLVMRAAFRFVPALFLCGAALLAAPALAQQSGLGCPFPAPVNAACPGDTYPIGNGFCTLRCAPGEEQNPWDPNDCRKPVSCPGGTEFAEGQCECGPGMEENPFASGSCRAAFSCSGGKAEVAESVCECPADLPLEVGGVCQKPLCPASGFAFETDSCGECPAGLTAVSIPMSNLRRCETPNECDTPGFALNMENECVLSGECPAAGEAGHESCQLRVARETLMDSDCPVGGGDSCQTELRALRATREFMASPVSHIPGIARARELGLTGKGVTIGVRENRSPYWRDDCLPSPLYRHFHTPSLPHPPVPRPNEEVPARYANYPDGECQRGLVRTHSDLPSIRVQAGAGPTPSSAFETDRDHAIGVFGYLAAQENGYGLVGIAPESDYAYARPFQYDSVLSDAAIINNSYGRSGINILGGNNKIINHAVLDGNGMTLTAATRRKLLDMDAAYNDYYNRQLRVSSADRQIYVWGGGNSGNDNLATTAGLPLYLRSLRRHHLAAVLVKGGEIASSSNRCGLAGADFCIAVPVEGWRMAEDTVTDLFGRAGGGTSDAAPLLAGALALVKEYFNRMGGIGNHELTGRILRSADDSGIYADESIYGAGLLDLEGALNPMGRLRLLSGESVWDGEGVLLSESELFSGEALGDSAFRALRGLTLAAFDDLHAPFPISSETVLRGSESSRTGLGSHLRRWQVGGSGSSGSFSFSAFRDGSAWWSLNAPGDSHFDWDEGGFGGEDSPAVFSDWVGNPYSGLAGRGLVAGSSFRLSGGGGFRMAMFGESLGNEKRFRGVLAEFSFSPFGDSDGSGGGDAKWFAQAGGIRESDGLLDSSGSGLFSDLRSRTAFAGLGFAGGLPDGWRYRLGAHWGRTSAEGAWLSATDSLRSGSYAAGLERSNVLRSGDGLGFRVRQPLRVSGGLKFRVPTGRTKYGELTWSEVSGVPSGRELEWEARYRRPYDGGHWGVSAVLVSESGHRSGSKTEGRALFAFERSF